MGQQSKRSLSEHMASKPRFIVLPLKNGDYLLTFKSHSKNLLRHFVRDLFKDDESGKSLEGIKSAVENQCDINRLKQLKIIKTKDGVLPFPVTNHVLMDVCSDLIFPFYV